MNALRRSADTARDLLLLVLPHGGQLTARRNAWAGMSENATRSRAQREAVSAMDRAALLSELRPPYAARHQLAH